MSGRSHEEEEERGGGGGYHERRCSGVCGSAADRRGVRGRPEEVVKVKRAQHWIVRTNQCATDVDTNTSISGGGRGV